MNELYTQLKQFGHVKLNEPMSKHTTFKIGGSADVFLSIDSTESVVGALKYLDGEGVSYFILGGGSNMLVRDEGYRGVVIRIQTSDIRHQTSDIVQADAGCATVEVAQKSIAAGLTGFVWGVGVPGTIGGAVRGNAGAMGGEMRDVVESVEIYQDGEIRTLGLPDMKFGYRESVLKHVGGVVLRVFLKLQTSENTEGTKKAIEYLKYRSKTQPQGYSSTGCIFKNYEFKSDAERKKFQAQFPDDPVAEGFIQKGKVSAGWLVEKASMKGAKAGKALASERHGNFIVNTGGATAADVLILIDEIKGKVYDRYGIEIEEEIQII